MTSAQDQTPQESMGIDPVERRWMISAGVLLVVFLIGITVAGFAAGFQLPGVEGRVDPATITEEGPFSTPGLRQISDTEFEAYVVARIFAYDPAEIVIPAGSTLTVFVTSADVQHGFKVTDTNLNLQIVPGHVSKLSATFETPGEYRVICTEYCGTGHAAMFGTVKVVSPAEFQALEG
jgi:cytochrome c oxidase subunit 2